MTHRIERDTMGPLEVPADRLWGDLVRNVPQAHDRASRLTREFDPFNGGKTIEIADMRALLKATRGGEASP